MCDPAFHRRVDQSEPADWTLHHENCYDLYNLGRFYKRGYWDVTVRLCKSEYLDANGPAYLRVKILYTADAAKELSPEKGELSKETRLDIPLYLDHGHNTVHVDIDKMPPGEYEKQGLGKERVAAYGVLGGDDSSSDEGDLRSPEPMPMPVDDVRADPDWNPHGEDSGEEDDDDVPTRQRRGAQRASPVKRKRSPARLWPANRGGGRPQKWKRSKGASYE